MVSPARPSLTLGSARLEEPEGEPGHRDGPRAPSHPPPRRVAVAAFAAGAEAHLTGHLAVCAGSCGPGHLHLMKGLYDAHGSRVPVLAVAAHIPSRELGSGYFQETPPEQLSRECSHYCELVSHPEQMPRVLEIAVQTAVSRRGVSVVVLPGDIALQPAAVSQPHLRCARPTPSVRPSDDELHRLTVSHDERPTEAAGLLHAWVHGQCATASHGGAAEPSRPPGDHVVRGRRAGVVYL